MNKPKIATIKFFWIDESGCEHEADFSEKNLDGAYLLLGLMIGEISEEDLKP